MVVRLISQTLPLSKKVLSTFVQRHVKKIFTQTTQRSQGVKFLITKSSKLIFLSGVHKNCFRDQTNITAKSKTCTALDQENKEVATAPFYLLARFGSPDLEARGIQTAH